MNFAAFLSYVLLTSITPGPNNIMSMANAGRFGFRRSLPFNFGVFAGFIIVMAGCALFSSLLYELVPTIEPFMLCAGAAYILWLAVSVLRSGPHACETRGASASFAAGMTLQFVNVKVILYGVTAMSSFILPYYGAFAEVAAFAFFLAFMGFACTLCWSAFGAVFELFFSKYRKPFNVAMALMLAYCAATMLAGLWK